MKLEVGDVLRLEADEQVPVSINSNSNDIFCRSFLLHVGWSFRVMVRCL